MTLASLHPLADRAALYAALRSEDLKTLTDTLGEHRWDVDLDSGTVTFSPLAEPDRRVAASAELVATIAPADGTILWGWAHPQGNATGPAATLRQRGEEDGISVLTEPQVRFPDEASGRVDEWVSDAAFVIGLAATEIIGRGHAFVTPVDGGTHAVFLLDAGLAAPTVAHTLGALPRVLSTVPLRDGRTAAWGLARLAGWQFEWSDAAFTGARISDGVTEARFAFDETARIVEFG